MNAQQHGGISTFSFTRIGREPQGPLRETQRRPKKVITGAGPGLFAFSTEGLGSGPYLLELRVEGHTAERARFVVVR